MSNTKRQVNAVNKMSAPDTHNPTLKRASAPKHRKITKTYSILSNSRDVFLYELRIKTKSR